MLSEEGILTSSDPVTQGRQHTIRPHRLLPPMTTSRGSSGSGSGLADARTIEPVYSFWCIVPNLSYLLSYPPSLGMGLLTTLFRHVGAVHYYEGSES